MEQQPKRRVGRPAKYQGRRPTLTIRVQEAVHGNLRQAASDSGRSISEEIESRLTDSFESGKRLDQFDFLIDEAKKIRDAAKERALEQGKVAILTPEELDERMESVLRKFVAQLIGQGVLPKPKPPRTPHPDTGFGIAEDQSDG